MNNQVLSNVSVMHFLNPISQEELIRQMGQFAIENGWAKKGYIEALLAREEKFATGLHTSGVEVAIPHADPEWTNEPGMVVGVLDEPVVFQPMGGYGGDVMAKFVFMLIIPDADSHIEFLSALSTFIEDGERLANLEKSRDIEGFLQFLDQAMVAN